MANILPFILVVLTSFFVIFLIRYKEADKKRDRAYETWMKFYGYEWIKNTNKNDIDIIKSYDIVSFRFNGKKYIAKKEDFNGSDMVKTVEGVHIKKEEIPEKDINHNRISQGILKGGTDKSRILVLMKMNTEGISDTGLITTYPVVITDGYEDDKLTHVYFLSTFPYANWKVSKVLATFEREIINDLFKDWESIEKSETGDGDKE